MVMIGDVEIEVKLNFDSIERSLAELKERLDRLHLTIGVNPTDPPNSPGSGGKGSPPDPGTPGSGGLISPPERREWRVSQPSNLPPLPSNSCACFTSVNGNIKNAGVLFSQELAKARSSITSNLNKQYQMQSGFLTPISESLKETNKEIWDVNRNLHNLKWELNRSIPHETDKIVKQLNKKPFDIIGEVRAAFIQAKVQNMVGGAGLPVTSEEGREGAVQDIGDRLRKAIKKEGKVLMPLMEITGFQVQYDAILNGLANLTKETAHTVGSKNFTPHVLALQEALDDTKESLINLTKTPEEVKKRISFQINDTKQQFAYFKKLTRGRTEDKLNSLGGETERASLNEEVDNLENELNELAQAIESDIPDLDFGKIIGDFEKKVTNFASKFSEVEFEDIRSEASSVLLQIDSLKTKARGTQQDPYKAIKGLKDQVTYTGKAIAETISLNRRETVQDPKTFEQFKKEAENAPLWDMKGMSKGVIAASGYGGTHAVNTAEQQLMDPLKDILDMTTTTLIGFKGEKTVQKIPGEGVFRALSYAVEMANTDQANYSDDAKTLVLSTIKAFLSNPSLTELSFVGHSLGGGIVKEALEMINEMNLEKELKAALGRDISIKGISVGTASVGLARPYDNRPEGLEPNYVGFMSDMDQVSKLMTGKNLRFLGKDISIEGKEMVRMIKGGVDTSTISPVPGHGLKDYAISSAFTQGVHDFVYQNRMPDEVMDMDTKRFTPAEALQELAGNELSHMKQEGIAYPPLALGRTYKALDNAGIIKAVSNATQALAYLTLLLGRSGIEEIAQPIDESAIRQQYAGIIKATAEGIVRGELSSDVEGLDFLSFLRTQSDKDKKWTPILDFVRKNGHSKTKNEIETILGGKFKAERTVVNEEIDRQVAILRGIEENKKGGDARQEQYKEEQIKANTPLPDIYGFSTMPLNYPLPPKPPSKWDILNDQDLGGLQKIAFKVDVSSYKKVEKDGLTRLIFKSREDLISEINNNQGIGLTKIQSILKDFTVGDKDSNTETLLMSSNVGVLQKLTKSLGLSIDKTFLNKKGVSIQKNLTQAELVKQIMDNIVISNGKGFPPIGDIERTVENPSITITDAVTKMKEAGIFSSDTTEDKIRKENVVNLKKLAQLLEISTSKEVETATGGSKRVDLLKRELIEEILKKPAEAIEKARKTPFGEIKRPTVEEREKEEKRKMTVANVARQLNIPVTKEITNKKGEKEIVSRRHGEIVTDIRRKKKEEVEKALENVSNLRPIDTKREAHYFQQLEKARKKNEEKIRTLMDYPELLRGVTQERVVSEDGTVSSQAVEDPVSAVIALLRTFGEAGDLNPTKSEASKVISAMQEYQKEFTTSRPLESQFIKFQEELKNQLEIVKKLIDQELGDGIYDSAVKYSEQYFASQELSRFLEVVKTEIERPGDISEKRIKAVTGGFATDKQRKIVTDQIRKGLSHQLDKKEILKNIETALSIEFEVNTGSDNEKTKTILKLQQALKNESYFGEMYSGAYTGSSPEVRGLVKKGPDDLRKHTITEEDYERIGIAAREGFERGLTQDEIRESIMNDLLEKWKKDLEIKSPSKKTEKIGDNASKGFGVGLLKGFESVKNKMGKATEDLLLTIQNKAEIKAKINPVKAKESIKKMSEDLNEFIGDIDINPINKETPINKEDKGIRLNLLKRLKSFKDKLKTTPSPEIKESIKKMSEDLNEFIGDINPINKETLINKEDKGIRLNLLKRLKSFKDKLKITPSPEINESIKKMSEDLNEFIGDINPINKETLINKEDKGVKNSPLNIVLAMKNKGQKRINKELKKLAKESPVALVSEYAKNFLPGDTISLSEKKEKMKALISTTIKGNKETPINKEDKGVRLNLLKRLKSFKDKLKITPSPEIKESIKKMSEDLNEFIGDIDINPINKDKGKESSLEESGDTIKKEIKGSISFLEKFQKIKEDIFTKARGALQKAKKSITENENNSLEESGDPKEGLLGSAQKIISKGMKKFSLKSFMRGEKLQIEKDATNWIANYLKELKEYEDFTARRGKEIDALQAFKQKSKNMEPYKSSYIPLRTGPITPLGDMTPHALYRPNPLNFDDAQKGYLPSENKEVLRQEKEKISLFALVKGFLSNPQEFTRKNNPVQAKEKLDQAVNDFAKDVFEVIKHPLLSFKTGMGKLGRAIGVAIHPSEQVSQDSNTSKIPKIADLIAALPITEEIGSVVQKGKGEGAFKKEGIISFLTLAGGVSLISNYKDELLKFGKASIDTAMRFEVLQGVLNYSVGGTESGQSKFMELKDEANKIGTEVESLIESYNTLSIATKMTSLEGPTTDSLVKGMSRMGVSYGLGTEEVKGAQMALSQVASKGIVQMEELRGQLSERIPGAFQIAARAMKMTESELMNLVATGRLTASEFLPKFADQLEKESFNVFSKRGDVAVASLNRFKNAVTDAQLTLGQMLLPFYKIILGIATLGVGIVKIIALTSPLSKIIGLLVLLKGALPVINFIKRLESVFLSWAKVKVLLIGLKDFIFGVLLKARGTETILAFIVRMITEGAKKILTVWAVAILRTIALTIALEAAIASVKASYDSLTAIFGDNNIWTEWGKTGQENAKKIAKALDEVSGKQKTLNSELTPNINNRVLRSGNFIDDHLASDTGGLAARITNRIKTTNRNRLERGEGVMTEEEINWNIEQEQRSLNKNNMKRQDKARIIRAERFQEIEEGILAPAIKEVERYKAGTGLFQKVEESNAKIKALKTQKALLDTTDKVGQEKINAEIAKEEAIRKTNILPLDYIEEGIKASIESDKDKLKKYNQALIDQNAEGGISDEERRANEKKRKDAEKILQTPGMQPEDMALLKSQIAEQEKILQMFNKAQGNADAVNDIKKFTNALVELGTVFGSIEQRMNAINRASLKRISLAQDRGFMLDKFNEPMTALRTAEEARKNTLRNLDERKKAVSVLEEDLKRGSGNAVKDKLIQDEEEKRGRKLTGEEIRGIAATLATIDPSSSVVQSLEAEATLRDEKEKTLDLEKQAVDDIYNVRMAQQGLFLAQLEDFRAEGQAENQRALSGVTKGLNVDLKDGLKNDLGAEDTFDVKQGELQLQDIKKQMELNQESIGKIKQAQKDGKMSLAEYTQRSRDLLTEDAQLKQQLAEQEVDNIRRVSQARINELQRIKDERDNLTQIDIAKGNTGITRSSMSQWKTNNTLSLTEPLERAKKVEEDSKVLLDNTNLELQELEQRKAGMLLEEYIQRKRQLLLEQAQNEKALADAEMARIKAVEEFRMGMINKMKEIREANTQIATSNRNTGITRENMSQWGTNQNLSLEEPVKRAESSLIENQSSLRNTQSELKDLEKAYADGALSVERYVNEKRRLLTEQAQKEQSLADAEMARMRAIEDFRLSLLDKNKEIKLDNISIKGSQDKEWLANIQKKGKINSEILEGIRGNLSKKEAENQLRVTTETIDALEEEYQRGGISLEKYTDRMRKLQVEQAQNRATLAESDLSLLEAQENQRIDILMKSLDRQVTIGDAINKLEIAKTDVRKAGAESKTQGLEQIKAIGETLSPGMEKSTNPELVTSYLSNQLKLQEQIDQSKINSLKIQTQLNVQNLAIEKNREEVSLRKQETEARQALLIARNGMLAAQAMGDERAIAIAQQQVGLANDNLSAIVQQLDLSKKLYGEKEKQLGIESASTLKQELMAQRAAKYEQAQKRINSLAQTLNNILDKQKEKIEKAGAYKSQMFDARLAGVQGGAGLLDKAIDFQTQLNNPESDLLPSVREEMEKQRKSALGGIDISSGASLEDLYKKRLDMEDSIAKQKILALESQQTMDKTIFQMEMDRLKIEMTTASIMASLAANQAKGTPVEQEAQAAKEQAAKGLQDFDKNQQVAKDTLAAKQALERYQLDQEIYNSKNEERMKMAQGGFKVPGEVGKAPTLELPRNLPDPRKVDATYTPPDIEKTLANQVDGNLSNGPAEKSLGNIETMVKSIVDSLLDGGQNTPGTIKDGKVNDSSNKGSGGFELVPNNTDNSVNIQNLTVISSDPTGDARKVVNDLAKAKNRF